MKTKNLLPNRWKPIGWVFLALCVFWIMWAVGTDSAVLSGLALTLPWPYNAQGGELSTFFDGVRYNDDGSVTLEVMDELLSLGVILGLTIVGFARVKNEDERTAQMRLEALQWAVYGNTLALILSVLFVHGLQFVDVMLFNMFTPLLIFVLRFHWLLYKEAREVNRNESGILTL